MIEPIVWISADGKLPGDEPNCGFHGELCPMNFVSKSKKTDKPIESQPVRSQNGKTGFLGFNRLKKFYLSGNLIDPETKFWIIFGNFFLILSADLNWTRNFDHYWNNNRSDLPAPFPAELHRPAVQHLAHRPNENFEHEPSGKITKRFEQFGFRIRK